MKNKIFADLILIIHFLWILFMVYGFFLTLKNYFFLRLKKDFLKKAQKFLDRWLFRTLHLVGICFVTLLEIIGKYCPLTELENKLRSYYNPDNVYTDSFIAYYLEKIVYPDINIYFIVVPTMLVALFTILIYIIHAPLKVRLFITKYFLNK